jgi:integrase
MPTYKYERWEKRIKHTELDAWLERAKYFETKALIIALYLTGARVSELLGMKCKDVLIDYRRKIVILTIVVLKQRKNGAPYRETRALEIDLDQPYFQHFLKFWEYRNDRVGEEGKIFTCKRCASYYYIKRIEHDISPHAFRHSACQKMADAGLNVFQISRYTGHKKPSMLEHYIQSSSLSATPIREALKRAF